MDKGYQMLVIPVMGAASAIIIEKAATKYGHTFMKFGPNNLYLIGIIGAVQNLVSISFGIAYAIMKDRNYIVTKHVIVGMVLSHALTAVTLTALTTLAAKANLISARITLFGAVALTATSLIENLALFFAVKNINNV